MSRYSERLQVLISPDQQSRLAAEAARRRISVGRLVRDAIDHELGEPTREERLDAVDRLARLGAEPVPPETLRELIDGQFDDEVDTADLRRHERPGVRGERR